MEDLQKKTFTLRISIFMIKIFLFQDHIAGAREMAQQVGAIVSEACMPEFKPQAPL